MVEVDGSTTLAAHRKKLKSVLRNLERQKSYSEADLRHLGTRFVKRS